MGQVTSQIRCKERGEHMKELPAPNIVQTFKIENTTIKIADNFCSNVTEKEVARILERIARTSQRYFIVNQN